MKTHRRIFARDLFFGVFLGILVAILLIVLLMFFHNIINGTVNFYK